MHTRAHSISKREVVSVYLDWDNISAKERLHGELSRLVDLPRLMERAESGVDGGNTGRWGT